MKCKLCGCDQGKMSKIVFHFEKCPRSNWSLL
jgi:hypothetical protein